MDKIQNGFEFGGMDFHTPSGEPADKSDESLHIFKSAELELIQRKTQTLLEFLPHFTTQAASNYESVTSFLSRNPMNHEAIQALELLVDYIAKVCDSLNALNNLIFDEADRPTKLDGEPSTLKEMAINAITQSKEILSIVSSANRMTRDLCTHSNPVPISNIATLREITNNARTFFVSYKIEQAKKINHTTSAQYEGLQPRTDTSNKRKRDILDTGSRL